MDRDFLIQLTNSLYRLTLLFPKKEPLRYKMREIADDILADLIKLSPEVSAEVGPPQVKNKRVENVIPWAGLEVLDGFFEVAKEQNWVSPEEILKLQENYSKLKEELKIEVEEDKSSSYPFAAAREAEENSSIPELQRRVEKNECSSISERQEKILAFLKEQGRAQVWQIKQVLPEVTKRTLRRDFESLLKKGLVERTGERNNTFYQVPSERGERRESNSLRTKINQV